MESKMHFPKMALAIGFLITTALPSFAQAAIPVLDPRGRFVDSYGTSFNFTLCGEAGSDLCGVLTKLEGHSATAENLAFVGKQVMHATRIAANRWKGSVSAGGTTADATITMVGPDTIEIQGCQAAILCQTLTYHRV